MRLGERPYTAYVPRGLHSSKPDPTRCHVSVYSNDRSMSFHQCSRKPKEDAPLYNNPEATLPTCAQHISAARRTIEKEQARQVAVREAAQDMAAAEARAARIAELLGGIEVRVQEAAERGRFIHRPTGQVCIPADELLQVLEGIEART
jgi:hypothetical protein